MLDRSFADADPVGDFYRGKTITMLVASGVGGGYDTYARVFARHATKFIPGSPTIIAKNMPAANWLLFFPAFFLISTLFALNFLGDGLRDALDPKDR